MQVRTGWGRTGWLALVALVCVTIAMAGPKTAKRNVTVSATAENLMAASYAELETSNRYLAYAEKATSDGYHQIATMFRAIARAEAIHSSRLALMAGEDLPVAGDTPAVVTVGSTRQNLETSLTEEAYERGEMYPKYLRQAKKEKNDDAAHLFQHILDAELTHRLWYKQVLKDLDAYTAEGAAFYVCPDCGTVSRTAKNVCPSCAAPKQRFEKVS